MDELWKSLRVMNLTSKTHQLDESYSMCGTPFSNENMFPQSSPNSLTEKLVEVDS